MPSSPAPGGWGRARGDDRTPDVYPLLDGRLDLDHLDDATSLDVLGDDDDRPLLSERIRDGLEHAGVLPWIRRHRGLATGIAVVGPIAVLVGGIWWAGRPQPLGDPRVTATTGGNEPARLIVDPATGMVTAITQLVLVSSDEKPGTTVDTLGVVGPGLAQPQSRIIRALPGDTVTGAVTSQVDCATSDATSAVATASPSSYRVMIRRTSATDEVREDAIPLAGGEEWLSDIRASCVQIAADRDLRVEAVLVEPVAGTIAADVQMKVRNTSDQPWSALHVAPDAGPTVVASGPDVVVPADGAAWVPVRLWPDDCADPVAPLAHGVPLRASFGTTVSTPGRLAPNFDLPLDPSELDQVAAALRTMCTATPPTATLVRARVAGGTNDDSAGTITMYVDVTAPGAFLVEAETRAPDTHGLVTPIETPAVVADGVARLHVSWTLPQCFSLLAAGPPTLPVRLVDETSRRPYLLRLHGDALRLNVDRLCGRTVASVVR